MFLLQFANDIEQLLSPAHRKRRNQNRAASICRFPDNPGEFLLTAVFLCSFMEPIAVGRFQHDVVGSFHWSGIENNGLIVTSDIAGEQNSFPVEASPSRNKTKADPRMWPAGRNSNVR